MFKSGGEFGPAREVEPVSGALRGSAPTAAGVVAFGMLFRAIAVMVVVFAVAVSDKWLGLAAALTYAAGYSAALGLQLVAYYSGPVAGKAAQQ